MLNEDRMVSLLPELLKTFGTPIHFVELGANDGRHTEFMAQFLASTGRPWRFVAVEPDPRVTTTRPYGVDIFRGAVGAADGPAKFYLSSGHSETGMAYSGSSSLLPPGELIHQYWPLMRFDEAIQVEVVTLDTLCERFGLDWIDFLWCDTQGCEGEVARGGKRMMPKTKWFFTEYADGPIYEGQALFSELPGLMPNFRVHTDLKGDALFVNKSVSPA